MTTTSRALGSVSTGTLRADQLADAFLGAIDDLRLHDRMPEGLAYRAQLLACTSSSPVADDLPEDASETVEALIEVLDSAANPGWYFGSHPGDGADYGFWPVEEEEPSTSSAAVFDSLDIAQAHHLFASDHHEGQASELYERLCRCERIYKPGAMGNRWELLSDNGKEIYRELCAKHGCECEYDKLTHIVAESSMDADDDCVAWFLEHYDDNPQDLCNYDHSDFVNLDMCYCKDLISFYDDNEKSVIEWCDEVCNAYGYSNLICMLEGEEESIMDADDFKMALVNKAMTYVGGELNRLVSETAL